MTIINKVSQKSVMPGITPISDVPDAPTIGTATDVGTSRAYNNGSATVTFTSAVTGGTPTSYTATSTPGSFTASGAGSPLTVTGLQSATAYTFAVTGTNTTATGSASSATSSITATTVPQAPTIGTATDSGSGRAYNNGAASVSFTAPATGGKSITGYTVTSSPGSLTGTGASSPITVTGQSSATAYTYTVTATNANGTSSASSASGSVTATTVPQAPTIGTFTDGGTGTSGTLSLTLNATGGSAITNIKYSTDGTNYTATGSTTSPITISGLSVGTYTFYVKATNANGDSAASGSVSGTVITPSSFESIATFTGGSASTVTFSSIPQTYKSLQIRIHALAPGTQLSTQFNGSSSTNTRQHFLYGTGSAAASTSTTGNYFYTFWNINGLDSTTYPTVMIMDILDYASTAKTKVMRAISGTDRNGTSTGEIDLLSGLFNNTSALTSLTFYNTGGQNFTSGTTIALYGIKG